MTPLGDDHHAALSMATERVEAAKEAYEAAMREREGLIRDAASTGASYREIAAATGIAYQRVAQLLTGEKPAMRPMGSSILAFCSKCEAQPGEECVDVSRSGKRTGRGAVSFHMERHGRINDLLEGDEEPLPGEVGPLSGMYTAVQPTYVGGGSMRRAFMQASGYVTADPEVAATWVKPGGHVARWTGHKWEEVE